MIFVINTLYSSVINDLKYNFKNISGNLCISRLGSWIFKIFQEAFKKYYLENYRFLNIEAEQNIFNIFVM